MRNLKLILHLLHQDPALDKPEFVFFGGKHSLESDFISSEEIAFVFKGTQLLIVSLNDGTKKTVSLSEVYGETDSSPVVSAMFNELIEEFYCFHRGGEVYSFRISADGKAIGQALEPIEGGVRAVEWSFNDELGVVVNCKNEMFIVTSTCEVINYWDLQDETEGELKFINVGWGKKETQFQGSAGKASAFAKPEQVESNETGDDHSVSVTWRGDSSMFAVSYWCSKRSRRTIKIFNCEGVLQCSGEDMSGLERPLSWRPQGNLISTIQRLPNKYVVAFLEKNGLKHYDFTLPQGVKVIDMSWNLDSQILCTNCYNDATNEYTLLFWISRNYHWYLKQSFTFGDKPLIIAWDPKRENRIKLAFQSGAIHVIEFVWSTDHSGYSGADNKSYVSVIDNDKLLVTQFSTAVVPPPMAMWTLSLSSAIRQVCYPLQKSYYSVAAVLSAGITLFKKDDSDNLITSKILKFPPAFNPEMSYQWMWFNEECFACLIALSGGKTDVIAFDASDDSLSLMWKVTLEFPIVHLLATETKLVVGKSHGNYLYLSFDGQRLDEENDVFPELCLQPVVFGDRLIGLSEIGRLYIDKVQVASNVTSFLVARPFLIATTSFHTLLILKFTTDGCEEVTSRKLENGSKLVLTTGTSLIFQLPRGNLETIHPRALTFLSIGSLLDSCEYGEAVQLLRKNRILLDVCVDHNPDSFLQNVGSFVDQVEPQSLVILVSEMSSNDVTATTYSAFYNNVRSSLDDKINKVCSVLVEEMKRPERIKDYTLAILTCLVKMKRMEEAIKLADTDQSLQHLMFLVPVDKLYSHALEAYNLPAALKIAGKSQMDPKEYVPYLNNLREMDPDYMKFTIDKTLKKYSLALSHLALCEPPRDDECFAFIKDHALYREALVVFAKDEVRFKKSALLYADHLFKKRLFEEAGCMFRRGGELVKAIESFTAACNWQRAVAIAKEHNYSGEEMTHLGESLYERLLSTNMYKDAAQLSEFCLKDCDRAVDSYTRSYMWDDALRVAAVFNKTNFFESRIKARLDEYANSLLSEITSKNDTLLKYVDRVKIVRISKANKPKFQDFGDDMSETSSVSSRSGTSHTSKSSKMTRKANRKLWSLKEGNPREEEALLSASREIYASAEKSIGEVKKVCGALVFMELDDLARQLQEKTKLMLMNLQKQLLTLWPKDPNEEPTAAIDALIKCAPELHIPSNWEMELVLPTIL